MVGQADELVAMVAMVGLVLVEAKAVAEAEAAKVVVEAAKVEVVAAAEAVVAMVEDLVEDR